MDELLPSGADLVGFIHKKSRGRLQSVSKLCCWSACGQQCGGALEELLHRGMDWIGQSKKNAGTGCVVRKSWWEVFMLVLAGVGVFRLVGWEE